MKICKLTLSVLTIAIGTTASVFATETAGLHNKYFEWGNIQNKISAYTIEYIGKCYPKPWKALYSSLGDEYGYHFISQDTEPSKNLMVRLISAVSKDPIEMDYNKKEKGTKQVINLYNLGSKEKGEKIVDYEIFNKKTDEIVEAGSFAFELDLKNETTKTVDGTWKLELYCLNNRYQSIEQCKVVAQEEVRYCGRRKTQDVRNRRVIEIREGNKKLLK